MTDDATIATSNTSNQLGREDNEVNTTGLKTHDLQEGVSQAMASIIYDLEEDCQWDHKDVASAAINYLPNFVFYMCNKMVEPAPLTLTAINFEEAFEQKLIEPTTFDEAFHHPDPVQRTKWHDAIHKEFRDMTNQGVWQKVKCSIPKVDDVSSQNGYSRSSMMESFMLD